MTSLFSHLSLEQPEVSPLEASEVIVAEADSSLRRWGVNEELLLFHILDQSFLDVDLLVVFQLECIHPKDVEHVRLPAEDHEQTILAPSYQLTVLLDQTVKVDPVLQQAVLAVDVHLVLCLVDADDGGEGFHSFALESVLGTQFDCLALLDSNFFNEGVVELYLLVDLGFNGSVEVTGVSLLSVQVNASFIEIRQDKQRV